jgi:hypothetical protein
MLTSADVKSVSFGFFRDLSPSSAIQRHPAKLFDGIPDGIYSERRIEWQSEQRVAGLGNDRVGVIAKSAVITRPGV